jgi:4-hydroxybenzoate polyprenyltransferase
MRPHQWFKQVFVFVPLLSLGTQLEFKLITQGLLAVLVFTFVAGIVYITNDVADFEEDRLDSRRVSRPIAAGLVSVSAARVFQILLFVPVIALLNFFSESTFSTIALILVYILINYLYSKFHFKSRNILGISIVAAGFPMRFAFGCLFCGIEVSYWALALLMQLALFMLSMKRYQRSLNGSRNERELIHDFWLLAAIVFAAAFSSTYAGFISAPSTQIVWGKDFLLLSAIPMALAIVRFIEVTIFGSKKGDLDVTEKIYYDFPMVLLVLIYCGLMFIGSATH